MARRPTALMVIAVFHFLVAAAGLLVCLCGIGLVAIGANAEADKFGKAPAGKEEGALPGGPNAPAADPHKERVDAVGQKLGQELEAEGAVAGLVSLVTAILYFLVFPAVLIVSGIGLLSLQPWARIVSLLYALVSLGHKIFLLIFMASYFTPLFLQALQRLPERHDPALAEEFQMLEGVVQVLTWLPLPMMVYPLLVLITVLLPSVAAAFRGEQSGSTGGDGPTNYDQGDRGRWEDENRWQP